MGKTVTTYLIDGDPKGTQYAFISNKICQMFVVPRSNLSYLNTQEKLQKPAFYMLLGEDENTKPQAYIGETENFRERVKDHDSKKSFWQKALIFVSKDADMTKVDVQYLEYKAIEEAKGRITEYEGLLSERNGRKEKLLSEVSVIEEKLSAFAEKESANSAELSAIALSAAIVQKDIENIELAITQLLEGRDRREEKIASLNERKALVIDKNSALASEIDEIENEKLRLSNLSEEGRTEISALFAQRQDFESRTGFICVIEGLVAPLQQLHLRQ